MTPADGTFYVRFYNGPEGGKPSPLRQVIAWNDNGDAMILGKSGLIVAHEQEGFQYVWREKAQFSVVAVIPGGGWMVEHELENGNLHVEPVVAWTIQADGTGMAQVSTANGLCGRPAENQRIYHPDETAAEPA